MKNKIRSFSNSEFVKNIFFELKKNKCEICGSKKHLEIHHIEFVKDHNKWQLLCRECHTRTHQEFA
jgi:hypothetical protein